MSRKSLQTDPMTDPAGLCAQCRHCQQVTNARGSTFFRCGRADSEPAFVRYPRLPVSRCAGCEPLPDSTAAQRTTVGPDD
jgi:hypothetical protein